MIQSENQIKYGLTKEVNFTIVILKKGLKGNDIEMHWIHNEGNSVVSERFIRTLKIKIYNTWIQYEKMCISINYMIL